ncbi:unnamed protein product [Urochloa decumbens]|uniref:Uncharacterized protein n=3 Tax=Urochloa decumbens TaxID=240449 RepID=A0ABC9GJA6_9POAL
MTGSCSMLNKMMAIFLAFVILTFASTAQCRPYQIRDTRSMVTNSNANTTMITKTDGNNACDFVFCTKHSTTCFGDQGDTLDFCYCCEPDPKYICYATRSLCRTHCPFCKT